MPHSNSISQQQQQRPAGLRRRTPQFKGVRRRHWGRWVAEIRIPHSRDRLWLGSYATACQAARAYDVAAACLRGPAAPLNLPSVPLPPQAGTECCPSPGSIRRLAAQEATRLLYANPHLHQPAASAQSAPPSLLLTEELAGNGNGDGAHREEVSDNDLCQDPPSLVDLWFGLDLGAALSPRLRALLTLSLYPDKGTQQQ